MRYDYKLDPFTMLWHPVEEMRERGVYIEDPRISVSISIYLSIYLYVCNGYSMNNYMYLYLYYAMSGSI